VDTSGSLKTGQRPGREVDAKYIQATVDFNPYLTNVENRMSSQ